MNVDEYERLDRVEHDHWWFAGLRDLLARLIRAAGMTSGGRQQGSCEAVLDAGCGTGENLRFLDELLQPPRLAGFDLSPEAVERARRKAPRAAIEQADLTALRIERSGFDLVLCCDVLYTTGLAAARPGLESIVEGMPPGGILILHVPAYQWLYSPHDVAVHTRERFTARQIRQLVADIGLQEERLTYRVSLLFPLIVLRRLPALLARLARGGNQKETAGRQAETVSEVAMPHAWLNRLLRWVLSIENRIIEWGVSLPFGSSIIAVARKRDFAGVHLTEVAA